VVSHKMQMREFTLISFLKRSEVRGIYPHPHFLFIICSKINMKGLNICKNPSQRLLRLFVCWFVLGGAFL
jgi:hypothetical protein